METILYFVRHAESVYEEGRERTRGLSEQGMKDARKVSDILRSQNIDIFVSSPYERAIETIRLLAEEQCREIHLEEDLRERTIGDFAPASFWEAKRVVYEDFNESYPGGESSEAAQKRAMEVITRHIEISIGKKIAIGTHGDIMTLMLNYFDQRYGYAFWKSMTMPDIYKVRVEGKRLIEVKRMWM